MQFLLAYSLEGARPSEGLFPHSLTGSAWKRRWHKRVCFRYGSCVSVASREDISRLERTVEKFGACVKLPKQQVLEKQWLQQDGRSEASPFIGRASRCSISLPSVGRSPQLMVTVSQMRASKAGAHFRADLPLSYSL